MPTESIDLIVEAGLVVTMNQDRDLVTDGAVAVHGGRIVAIAARQDIEDRYVGKKRIGGSKFIAMPGFIDGHSHAGHGLVRTMGADDFPVFREACRKIYVESASLDFWAAEARLSGLERLKAGVTTSVLFLGGGDENNRSDTPDVAKTYARAFTSIGPDLFLGIGPSRPPFPRHFNHFVDGRTVKTAVDFDRMVEVCTEIADTLPNQKVRVAFTTPVVNPVIHSGAQFEMIGIMAKTMKALARSRGMMLMIDGHRGGTVAYAAVELDILDDKTLLSHAIGLSDDEIAIVAERRSVVANNAISASAIWDRCPVPELIAAGARVILTSDGLAPDGGSDMFDLMRGAMRYHRASAHNPNLLPPGRALAMTTIDAAEAFGIDDEVGSLEVAKKADIILCDTNKPHLQPAVMPLHQLLMYANAQDVDAVVLGGRIVMENRRIDEEEAIIAEARAQSETMLDRAGLRAALSVAPDFWHDAYDRPIRDGINHHRAK